MSGNSSYEDPISSEMLKEALNEASSVLGRAAQDAMFNDLELNGIDFKDGSYTLMEVQDALQKIFGWDGTDLLMRRVEKSLS